LASSCARATTAEEAGYRIDAPIAPRQGARVVALDDRAAATVRRAAQEPWNAARFFTLPAGGVTATAESNGVPDIVLHRTDGTASQLRDELAEGDVVVIVATTDGNAAAAAAIGRACARRGIMTAGIILGERSAVGETVTALRPHAQVLLVTQDDQDLSEVLGALRA